jgi:hypothetical protein
MNRTADVLVRSQNARFMGTMQFKKDMEALHESPSSGSAGILAGRCFP